MNLLDAKIQQPNINQNYQPKKEVISSAPIATTALQKPDRPSVSYLVNEPFYYEPINFVKDIKENIVNIGKGIQGHSNDHDLGRINDFTMRAGSLALAGYLFTKARTPMTKLMEFVGFGSFFASMALWPKLFIEKPLQALYGVNIRQKYVDYEGRKKSFFQDPQYLPWDLYSNDELAKLGDRMGVPKDIHNRNEVIKRKAHKIALQGNTLWMLTAGFATPIMSALICSGVEKAASPLLEKIRIEKAERDLKNIDKLTEKAVQKYNPSKLEGFLTVSLNREISPRQFNAIVNVMHHDSDILESDYITMQLEELFNTHTGNVSKSYAEKFLAYIDKYAPESFTVVDENLTRKIMEFAQDGTMSQERFHRKIKGYLIETGADPGQTDTLVGLTERFRDDKRNLNILYLTEENAEKVRILDRKLYEFASRKKIIDKYKDIYLGDVAESFAANKWKKITETFFKVLGVKDGELKIAKLNGQASYKLLTEKMEKLVSDENAYKNAVSKLQNAILEFDRIILPDKADGASQGVRAVLDKHYTALADSCVRTFSELGFGKISEHLVGNGTTLGSLKDNLNDRTFRRTWELRNNFYKLLHVLDCFKRAADAEQGWDTSKFAQVYRNLSESHGGVELNPTAETLKKDLKQFKDIVLKATMSDYETKFGYNNAQFGLYTRMMNMIYNMNFDSATTEALKDEALGEITFMQAFKKKIGDTLSNLGNSVYPHASKVTARGNRGWVGDMLVRDSLCGARIDEIFRTTASNVYNSRKWLKMFGGAGLVLVAGTLLSQMFFGRLSEKEVMSERSGN